MPFTIPDEAHPVNTTPFTAIERFLDADGFAVGMIAGQSLQQTEFDLGINVYLSRLTVTLHLDDATNYNNVAAFGMVGWDYGTTSSRIIIFKVVCGRLVKLQTRIRVNLYFWGLLLHRILLLQNGLNCWLLTVLMTILLQSVRLESFILQKTKGI